MRHKLAMLSEKKLDGEVLRVADRAAGGVRRAGSARLARALGPGALGSRGRARRLARRARRGPAVGAGRRLRRRPGWAPTTSSGSPTPSRRPSWSRRCAGWPTPSRPRRCWWRSRTAPSRISSLVDAAKQYSQMDRDAAPADRPARRARRHPGDAQRQDRVRGDRREGVRPQPAGGARLRRRAQPGVDQPDRQRARRHGRGGDADPAHGAGRRLRAGRDRRHRPGHPRRRCAGGCSSRSSPPSRWGRAPGSGSTSRGGSSSSGTAATCG